MKCMRKSALFEGLRDRIALYHGVIFGGPVLAPHGQEARIRSGMKHMIERAGGDLDFHRSAASLRHRRLEVLAANIANADTPNYKSRDFDFQAALREATGNAGLRLGDTCLALTSVRHIPGRALGPGQERLLYRLPYQPSIDGNTVDMDVERVQFADNALRYQTDLTVISSRIKTMMAALQQ